MAANKSSSTNSAPQPPRSPDALERLYVYWLLSTIILLFAIVVATVYTRGAQYTQARLINELTDRVVELERTMAEKTGELRPATAERPATPAVQEPHKQPTSRAAGPNEPGAARPPGTSSPGQPTTAPARPSGTGVVPALSAPSESDAKALLDRALASGTATPYVIADRQAAERVLADALPHVAQAPWSGPTWARLAVLARLMSQDAAADAFAGRAYKSGDSLVSFSEVSARVMLARGQVQDARMHAEHFAEESRGAPAARLLLARVFLGLESPATADELLATITDLAPLTIADRLALARVYLTMHHWQRLSDVMATVTTVPAELEAEGSFLQAVSLIQRSERLVEALGILDYLADQLNQQAATKPAAAADAAPTPSAYEVATWRGVALMRGQQIAAARQALDEAAASRADRPEAYYWRAVLEIREKQFDTAKVFLQNALATSARFGPAWETLGWLALETGNTDAAVDNLNKAVAANERQASAQFLLAIAQAKANQREPAAAALRAAIALDADYLDKAQQVEAIKRLFSDAELQAIAAAAHEAPTTEDSDDKTK